MNAWAITDKGIVRKENQDTYYTYCDDLSGKALLLVCDGMGGANAGSVASRVAAEIFVDTVKDRLFADQMDELPADLMREGFRAANRGVFDMSNETPEYSGMGTTLVGAALLGDQTVVVNAGDSRAYLISNYTIQQITRDHSVVEDMVRRGDITREDSLHHPHKNLITRALGTAHHVACDVFFPTVNENDCLLLCSDGLSNIVSEQEMLYEVMHNESLEDACCKLFNIAMMRGAPDNVTIVLLRK